jgi:hypothetical protein
MDPPFVAGGRSMGVIRQRGQSDGDSTGGEGRDDGVEQVVRAGQPVLVPGKVQPRRLLPEASEQHRQAPGFGGAASFVAAGVQAPQLQ